MGAGITLRNTVHAKMDELWPLWRQHPGTLPEGLVLQIHPRALNKILQDPEMWDSIWDTESKIGDKFRLPVKVTSELEPGHFRLAVITEKEYLGGKL